MARVAMAPLPARLMAQLGARALVALPTRCRSGTHVAACTCMKNALVLLCALRVRRNGYGLGKHCFMTAERAALAAFALSDHLSLRGLPSLRAGSRKVALHAAAVGGGRAGRGRRRGRRRRSGGCGGAGRRTRRRGKRRPGPGRCQRRRCWRQRGDRGLVQRRAQREWRHAPRHGIFLLSRTASHTCGIAACIEACSALCVAPALVCQPERAQPAQQNRSVTSAYPVLSMHKRKLTRCLKRMQARTR